MFWPRLKLTADEKRNGATKYGSTGKRGVLRRMYPGFLELTENQRRPIFPFQISRRCRVFGITFAGDIGYFRLSITDVAGELFVDEPIEVSGLSPGYNMNPLSPLFPVTTNPIRGGVTVVPYIIDPNIVLLPNQTLTFEGSENVVFDDNNPTQRIDFVLHVWEFPGYKGSPQ